MAQKLQTIVTLSGEIDNSFGRLGSELTNLGNQVNDLSQRLIDFGQKSVKEFVDYDDIMREVQALGDYSNGQRAQMDAYNQMIAQDSRFTMQQAAQAEVMIAQLGLSWNQTKTLMPTVMDMAVAGNIELSDSLNYLYYSLNSLGMPLEYAGTLSDQMAKTAAISAADIDTLGLSLQRLGSGAQYFVGGSSEVLAILGGISQFGEDMQGAEAGTQLRNFMLTLMAPTASKAKLMEQLSISESEWIAFESYMADAEIDLTQTAAAMESLGLSAFDTNGNLKPAIQIIGELGTALANLESDAERESVLGTLFGKRTTTTAKNLLAAYDTIVGYQSQLLNNSTGYTQQMAETIDGGVGGTLRNTTAAIDALETKVGSILAPEVEFWAGLATDAVNTINNMDQDALEAMVSGGTTLAIAGPGLLTVGSAFRLIGRLITPTGWKALAITTLITGVATAIRYFNEAYETDFAEQFGELDLTATSLTGHIAEMGDSFRAGYAETLNYAAALDAAVESYSAASATFSGELFAHMVTGATLGEDDKQQLFNLGTEMHSALMSGLEASQNESSAYWTMLFGGTDAEGDTRYEGIMDVIGSSYSAAIAEAEALGQGLRDALTAAFADGTISEEERENIQSYIRAYNDAIAQAQAEARGQEHYVNMQMILNNAQTSSLESLETVASQMQTEHNAWLATADEEFWKHYYGLEYQGADEYTLANARNQYDVYRAGLETAFTDDMVRLWENGLQDSGLGAAYGELGALSDMVLSGDLTAEYARAIFPTAFGDKKQRKQLTDYFGSMFESLGGFSGVESAMVNYRAAGDYENEQRMAQLMTMGGIVLGFPSNYDRSVGHLIADPEPFDLDKARELANTAGADMITDALQLSMENQSWQHLMDAQGNLDTWNNIEGLYGDIITKLQGIYDFDRVLADESWGADGGLFRNYQAAYSLMYGNASLNPEQYLLNQPQEPVTSTMEIPNGAEAAAVANSDAQAFLAANPLSQTMTIRAQYSGISAVGSGVGGGRLATNMMQKYAEGGRATTASIFGEAGAEWAIPEEHTQRVADLLNAARQGAGFTWPELLSRTGGLNAASNHQPVQLIYSPVIHAQDATGVEEKLLEDKERLNRWLAEKQMMDEVEVYA